MSHEDRPPGAPASAAGDSIILQVPACVQRFSSRRRILTRLRALARRRSRGLPDLDSPPLKLHVEENPDWPPVEAEPETCLRSDDPDDEGSLIEIDEGAPGSMPAGGPSAPDGLAPAAPADPAAALIEELLEDNRDLKAALCRLIRIAEENNAELRLLEEENDELTGLVRRLTLTAAAKDPQPAAGALRRRWRLGGSAPWAKRWTVRRCR